MGSTIDRADVARLRVAWRSSPKQMGALTTAPIVIDGIVYLEDGNGHVEAIDAANGRVEWSSAPSGFNIGPFGVAIADGRVFADSGSRGVVALDAKTGRQLWTRQISQTKSEGVDIQPTAADGLVLASTVPVSINGIYQGGDRGTVYALDARTGDIRWQFVTVSADLWGHPTINSGGGAWYPPAIDLRRHLVYVGVANPAPFPGTTAYPNGTSRPGDNLYADSLVALDLDTGHLRWYHQVTEHDLFDRDQVHALLATVGGREVVVSAGKSGEIVGLDPDTGKMLWQRAVGLHQNDDRTTLSGPTVVYPGTYGGVLTPPATASGVVYAAVINAPTTLRPTQTAYIGSDLGKRPGEIVAIDAANGHVLWDTKVAGDPLGGATVVNDLVFSALLDGTIVALDRSTGAIVWKYKAAGGINGWMAAVGDTLYVPVGMAQPPQLLALRLAG
ncbi:MAG TPA: PQQ-binding-like beta-propeller repeat protein [Acidimicrobiia bacterium]